MRNRLCWSPSCARRAMYGVADTGAVSRSCQEHRQVGEEPMVTSSRRCGTVNCSTLASFGPPPPSSGHTESRPLWCAKHKDTGDVDLRNHLCEAQMTGWDVQKHRAASLRCPNRASFGNPAEGLRRFCSLHRGKWDENFNKQNSNKKTCASRGCRAPSTGELQFCSRHRPDDIPLTSMLHPKIGNSYSWVPDHLWHSRTASPYSQVEGIGSRASEGVSP